MKKTIRSSVVSVQTHTHILNSPDTYESNYKVFRYSLHEPLSKLDVIDHWLELDNNNDARLNAWCTFVDQITFDFGSQHFVTAAIIDDDDLSENASIIIKGFCDAIQEYSNDLEGSKHKIEVSIASARNYFYLIPSFGRHSHHVTIDADTGFVNVGFRSRQRELLTALVTSTGEVHYSFVGRGRKLVKISGTAKIKDRRDFVSFKKILRMLWEF